MNFQLFEGAQDDITRLTAVCCMLLPHNPYRWPQHYKRHVCGSFCSCKHWVLWISLIFMVISNFWALVLCELYGYSMPLTTFLVKKESLLYRPVLIFQPTMNPSARYKQSYQCLNQIRQLGKMCSYCVSTYISVFVEGFGRWRGTFWLLNESLTFKGPAT